jgi:hypothetical protein
LASTFRAAVRARGADRFGRTNQITAHDPGMSVLNDPAPQHAATGAAPEAITEAGQIGIEVNAVAFAGSKCEAGHGPIGQSHRSSGHHQGISQTFRRGESWHFQASLESNVGPEIRDNQAPCHAPAGPGRSPFLTARQQYV